MRRKHMRKYFTFCYCGIHVGDIYFHAGLCECGFGLVSRVSFIAAIADGRLSE